MAKLTKEDFISSLKEMNLLEIKELVDAMKEEFGVDPSAVAVAAPVAGAAVEEGLTGPSAFAFSEDQIAPIKVLSDFAKNHPALVLKVGIVDNEVTDKAKLSELATIPSRDGLLTMLAGGMIGIVKDLSICLDLYSKEKE